jgi:pimeloyl-ACP methyl ester carboxylesterase
MVSQVRLLLDHYQSNGGQYSEVVLADCGHSPHIEKQVEMLEFFTDFIGAH